MRKRGKPEWLPSFVAGQQSVFDYHDFGDSLTLNSVLRHFEYISIFKQESLHNLSLILEIHLRKYLFLTTWWVIKTGRFSFRGHIFYADATQNNRMQSVLVCSSINKGESLWSLRNHKKSHAIFLRQRMIQAKMESCRFYCCNNTECREIGSEVCLTPSRPYFVSSFIASLF